MGIIGFIRRITGRRPHHVPVFSQQAAYLVQASRALAHMTDSEEHSQWRFYEREIKACEVQGDALLTELQEQLYEELMMASNRADLQALAMDIDVFLDHINDCGKSLLLYMPDRIDDQIRDMAQYIHAAAESLKLMMGLLADMKKNYAQISMQCDRITELEHAADDSFAEYIGYIFTNEKNAIEVMKYKNIAETFEAATDAAKVVSDTVRKMILRYIS